VSTNRTVVVQIHNTDAADITVRGVVRPIYLAHFAANHHVWGVIVRHVDWHSVDLDHVNVSRNRHCGCGWCGHFNIHGSTLALDCRLVIIR